MILQPSLSDFRLISHYTGRMLSALSLLFLIPLVTAALFHEWNVALDFVIGLNACFLIGGLFLATGKQSAGQLRWAHSMVVVSLTWLAATLVCAIPHYLSGHFCSYLDCVFDVMSGFTTTGLSLIQDMDHVSHGLNMWRHLLTFIGGQGMIALVLTFLIKGTAGAYMMYAGEAKEERLLPNVIHTARAIWIISMAYFVLGTALLWVVLSWEGMQFPRNLLHASWLTMSAWSTGGFAPQSQNIVYYHSILAEAVTVLIMIVGSLNFILHYTVWTGKIREMIKNIEVRSFSITVAVSFALLIMALGSLHIYADVAGLFRRAAYILVSGHTGTGLMNVYAFQLLRDWGPLSLLAVTIAMAIGGSACSTCGGIKGLRMGLVAKGFYHEIKRLMLTENTRFITTFHHIRDIILTDQHVKMAGLILLAFVLLYFGGGLLGAYYGYPFVDALFESTSAGSTTGLSCGITIPAMPAGLKLYYIFAMWAGRLEFIALFGLTAFVVSLVKRR